MIPEEDVRHRKLIASVIIQAVNDHQDNVKKFGPAVAMNDEPARWILSDTERVFGFVWCCSMIGQVPEKLRKTMNNPNLVRVSWAKILGKLKDE